jgi:DNA-binding transcriptional LysR family regulator
LYIACILDLELHQIAAFLAVAEEGHFGRAAERLSLAQPSLSRTIQHLERRLSAQLFERTTRSVRLSPHGKAFLDPALAIQRAVREAEEAVSKSLRGELGRVRLGFAGPSSHTLVSALAQLVGVAQPGIELALSSTTFGTEAISHLDRGELDLAIVSWPRTPPGMASRIVRVDRYVAVVPEDHRLADRTIVDVQDLMRDPWVLLDSETGSSLNDLIRLKTDETGLPLTVAQRAPDSWTVLALVAAGAGVTVTVDSVFAHMSPSGVRVIPLSGDWGTGTARLVWRADDHSPVLDRVLELSLVALPTRSLPGLEDHADG